jgi:hypothetical protein
MPSDDEAPAEPRPEHTPEFSVVRIASAPEVPADVADALATGGLPRDTSGVLDVYELVEPARFAPNLGERGFVVFGESGIAARLCVDAATGAVVQIASLDLPDATISQVNANLKLFRACHRALIDRFPFYPHDSPESGPGSPDAVGAELRVLFESIDPVAGYGFWYDLTYDVGMGDWATELLLDDSDE